MRGFLIHSTDDGRVPSFEYLPASVMTPKIGMGLATANGKLVLAAGGNKPTYISMCEKEKACESGDIIPVIRVSGDIIFSANATDDMAGVQIGDKVTISEDGLGVTATTDAGVAEVIGKEEDGVLVRLA